MSTPFYDLASLVVVPSGYKAAKVYAQKPLTTDGQLAFTRASTATRVNASGLIEAVASGVPRLDYLNSTCPKLLLEPQRTNNITYSEQLDNAAWTLANAGSASAAVVTANYGISPSGYQDAERVQFSRTGTTASDYSLIDRSTISTAAGVVSFYGKSLSGTQSILLYYGAVGQVFTLTTEWQRFSLYAPTTTADLSIGTRGGTGNYYSGGSLTIDCLLWGFQKEAGTYATSYIPTLGASVTRVADAASKTSISSLLSASEYTLFWDGTHIPTAEYNSFMTVYNNANSNISVRFYRNNTNNEIRASVLNPNSGLSLDLSSSVTTQTAKCALRVKAGSYAFYVNGTLVNSSASALSPSANIDAVNLQYFTSGQSYDQKTAQVLFFKTGLTNAQLAELTTL